MTNECIQRTIVASVLFFAILLPLHAQQYQFDRYEAVVGAGVTTIFGDIGGASTRTALSAGIRYTIQKRISVKASLDLGWGYGTDEGRENDARGYEYNTFLVEPSIQAEFHIYTTLGSGYNRKGYRLEVPRFDGYAFLGLGAVYFEPIPGGELKADFEDDFKHFSLVFPGGIGFNVGIARRIMIGMELGGRWARTDFIDGWTSGNSVALDFYYIGLLNVSCRFNSFSFKRGFQ